jgi:hypothetical protein
MARIRGEHLKRIKRKIKYGQRTPFRMALSVLKLFRHRGLPVNPVAFGLGAVDTLARHTWLEKTHLVPLLLWLPRKVAGTRAFDAVTRGIAHLLTPPLRGMNRLFDAFDARLGISTRVMPRAYDVFASRYVEPQRERAQIVVPQRAEAPRRDLVETGA